MHGRTHSMIAVILGGLALAGPLPEASATLDAAVEGRVEARLGHDARFGLSFDSDPYPHHRQYEHRHGASWHDRVRNNFDRLDGSLRSIRRAHAGFKQLAYERPGSPLPKIGLSLSNALLGNDRASIRNMRQAVLADAHALRTAPISYSGRRAVKRVRRYFIRYSNEYPRDAQLWFMRAAIDVMLGYNETARISIEHAMDYGANGRAADAVYRLLFRPGHPRGPRYGRRGPGYRDEPPRDRRPGRRRGRRR